MFEISVKINSEKILVPYFELETFKNIQCLKTIALYSVKTGS